MARQHLSACGAAQIPLPGNCTVTGTAISRILSEKGASILSALLEHEHPWALGFWDSMREEGFQLD
jgi:hypothetical protein